MSDGEEREHRIGAEGHEALIREVEAGGPPVLLLASMDGHSLNEVAELLQIPIGTVKSRLHSARKRLAEKLR